MIIAQEPLFYPIGQDPILRYAPKAKESPATILTSLVPPEPLLWSRWPPVQAHVTLPPGRTEVRPVDPRTTGATGLFAWDPESDMGAFLRAFPTPVNRTSQSKNVVWPSEKSDQLPSPAFFG